MVPVPLDAWDVSVNDALTLLIWSPFGLSICTRLPLPLTFQVSTTELLTPAPSVTVIVVRNRVPGPSVPVIAPVLLFSDRPVGAFCQFQVYGALPPVAVAVR